MITNKELINAFHSKDKLQAKLLKLKETYKALHDQICITERKVMLCNSISLIKNGVAIHQYHYGNDDKNTRYGTVLDENGYSRYASIWLNAENKKTWGISLEEFSSTGRQDHFLGSYWKTKKLCVEIAIEYVTTGKYPLDKQIY